MIGAEIFPWRIKFGFGMVGWGVGYCPRVRGNKVGRYDGFGDGERFGGGG